MRTMNANEATPPPQPPSPKWRGGAKNPSPQPPPRSGEGEQAGETGGVSGCLLPFSPLRFGGRGPGGGVAVLPLSPWGRGPGGGVAFLPLSASGRGPGGGVAFLPLSASGRGLGGGVALPPVRVCFLIDELATAGTETQLLALIRHLDRSRVQPYLVLLRGECPSSRELEPADCPVLRLGVGSLRSVKTAIRAMSFISFLWRNRIDVVQAYFPDSSYFGVPAAWLAGVPHRVRTRNNIGHWMTRGHRFLGQALNLFTTATVANCDAARRALLSDERPRRERVYVLENGVDLERFLALPLRGPTPVANHRALTQPGSPSLCVGAVANLRHVKGLDVLVRAAVMLAERFPEVIFRVAGEGEQRGQLEEQVRQAALSGRFELSGKQADVPGFLAGLDVAVLASRAEGMPNSVLEYMAAGRPIVATAVGAVPELISDGIHGLLVPPDDAGALAAAIARLLADRDLASRLAESARQRAVERYSRPAMVRRFEEFYTRLVYSRRRRHHGGRGYRLTVSRSRLPGGTLKVRPGKADLQPRPHHGIWA